MILAVEFDGHLEKWPPIWVIKWPKFAELSFENNYAKCYASITVCTIPLKNSYLPHYSHKWWLYQMTPSKVRDITFNIHENIGLYNRMIKKNKNNVLIALKPLLAIELDGHLEKWPPSWIFKWHFRQIYSVDLQEQLCQISCLYHNLHNSA